MLEKVEPKKVYVSPSGIRFRIFYDLSRLAVSVETYQLITTSIYWRTGRRKPPFIFCLLWFEIESPSLESNSKEFQTYMSKVELESRSLLLGSVTLLEE